MYNYGNYPQLSDIIGVTMASVTRETEFGDDRNEALLFTAEDGRKWALTHLQDCCEKVTIEDICGKLSKLEGKPILMAEEVDSENISDSSVCESQTWTFYKFATSKGYVTIRWYGTSNGYYSEGVNFIKVDKEHK